ncbi:MAG: 3-deoxy-manno-octulosonate cytidylyltransferase [Candidatus Methylomirabilales bacterium]
MDCHSLRILGVIPARLGSTRLPGKVLRPILGVPMLSYVYTRAAQSDLLQDLIVATDSEEVFRFCSQQGMKVMMTSSVHPSGTDRIYEVMTKIPSDIYVNIQGDEPMITPGHLKLLLQPFFDDPSVQVATLKTPISAEEARDPNNVKVVTDKSGKALYFSRSPIPYDRDGVGGITYCKHLGLYAYTRPALERFHQLPPLSLEQAERLEQLRFLEHGIPIHVVETPHRTIGVDTEEDLKKVEAYFSQIGNLSFEISH